MSFPRYCLPAVLALAAAGALADPSAVVAFKGGIGADPLTAANGVDQLNVVRGISPGGRAWVIRKLDATVSADGAIAASGKGLLLASGDVIATRGPVAQVAATLACGPADATAAKYTSEPAALDVSGNFNLRGTLRGADGNVAPLASMPCDNPLLLIRIFNAAGAGGWLAAGIVERDDD